VVADVSAGGEETVRLIEAAGGAARFSKTDVSQPAEVAAMVDFAVAAYGRLDCAVNNAGIEGALVPTAEYTDEGWQRVLDINLTGVRWCLKYEIQQMLEHGGGAIVNMASILGLVGFVNASAYTAAKHGVIGLTRAAALEYATRGIRVNAVCPGFIETPMVMQRGLAAAEHPEVLRQLEALHPMQRLGRPEEVAEPAVWLCSEGASFVTGHALAVDGGYLSQ
jgi:NAD(P)-dependent dehydrogenase (short-subunit alcohol dehydrogenase family)